MIARMIRILITCVLFALPVSALTAHAADIKGEEIRTLIAGKTFYGYTIVERHDVTWYFALDGLVKQRKKGTVSTGTWLIEEDTGRLCIQLRDPFSNMLEKKRCRVLERREDGKLEMHGLKEDGRRSGEGLKIDKIAEGNADNL